MNIPNNNKRKKEITGANRKNISTINSKEKY